MMEMCLWVVCWREKVVPAADDEENKGVNGACTAWLRQQSGHETDKPYLIVTSEIMASLFNLLAGTLKISTDLCKTD